MQSPLRFLPRAAAALILAMLAASPSGGQTPAGGGKLFLSGDLAYFMGMGKPLNCVLNSRFKRGDPVGFRMTAINPDTGTRDRRTQLVVHLNYGGKTVDLLLAATAMVHDLVLVTTNARDFPMPEVRLYPQPA